MKKNIACLILAAGRGTRMKSSLPKPLHEIHSRPMLGYLIDTVRALGIKRIGLVFGHEAGKLRRVFKGFDVVLQRRPLGSGDAIRCAKAYFRAYSGDILLLYSDTPLLKAETLKALIETHAKNGNKCTLLTAVMSDPKGYGRILRDDSGRVKKIVEETDAAFYEQAIREINVGAYMLDKKTLFENIDRIRPNRRKKEFFLTDIIEIFGKQNLKMGFHTTDDPTEAQGVNSRVDLALANEIAGRRVTDDLMAQGVTIEDPSTTSVDKDAKVGQDTVIYPHTIIEKDVVIGRDCRIGPYARLRPGTVLDAKVEVGNFVELVRTRVGAGCKIKHMTYLGDAVLGKGINIGAGTITANYDGKDKNRTEIGDNAFIGVGAILIAPVKIGRGAVVGAGSVVTKGRNVPADATVLGVPAKIYKKRTKNKSRREK
ncbi:MAG: NTP transferase domain-containing protein [Candidatus Omnitrophota bacterium]